MSQTSTQGVCATSPTCLPVPTPPGCVLLQLLTWLLTDVCATSPPACLCLLLLDACSFNYSRGYSQVCVRLLHLLACAYSSWMRAPSTTHVATHRCVCDFSTCLPVPTPPGRALLQLLTWLLTGVCATSPPDCLCLLLLDARSFNYSRGYSQVCVRLLHLLACAYSSWTRAPSTTHVATHRCVCDFSTCLPVPTPPGRALLQLLTWLLTGVCATSPPACLCLLLLDARSFNYSRGYSQVCVRLLHLLACAYSSWTRAPSTTHVATHRCVCDFSTCFPVPTPPGRALLQLLTWLLTGVCATSPPACLCLLLLDARSFNYSRGYSQVCVRLLHLLACAYSSWTRVPSTTHVATHRCVCDFSTCLPVPTPPGRALLQLLTWLLTGVTPDCLGTGSDARMSKIKSESHH